jgi:uroporphyrinogen decarboxylase
MNSLERSLAVISGKVPDRVPVSLHNFLAVGQFIGCHDMAALTRSGDLMAEAQIACWQATGHDMLQLENGVAALAESVGAEIRYSPTEPPHVAQPLLKQLSDVDKLKLPNPEKDFPLNENLKCTRRVVRELGKEVFVCGRSDQGPLALAFALRGVETLVFDLMDAASDPEKEKQVLKLIDFCTRCDIVYSQAQAAAGAHGTCIGGAGIEVMSPALHRKYEHPQERRWVEAVKAAGIVPFLHICGNEAPILEDMILTGAEVLELDPKTDMRVAKQKATGRTTLLGFIDPANVICRGTLALIEEKCREALSVLAPGGGFILSPGCALPIETPAEHMKVLVEAAKKYGEY